MRALVRCCEIFLKHIAHHYKIHRFLKSFRRLSFSVCRPQSSRASLFLLHLQLSSQQFQLLRLRLGLARTQTIPRTPLVHLQRLDIRFKLLKLDVIGTSFANNRWLAHFSRLRSVRADAAHAEPTAVALLGHLLLGDFPHGDAREAAGEGEGGRTVAKESAQPPL